jgi:hypothetical protein
MIQDKVKLFGGFGFVSYILQINDLKSLLNSPLGHLQDPVNCTRFWYNRYFYSSSLYTYYHCVDSW